MPRLSIQYIIIAVIGLYKHTGTLIQPLVCQHGIFKELMESIR